MPEPIADDLRRRLLRAWGAKEGSLLQLARRFGVSHAFAKKIRQQQRRTGQAERIAQTRHGPVSRLDEAARARLRGWVREQPDRTIAELQGLLAEHGVRVCWARVEQVLPTLGLRRKKKRCTPSSATVRRARRDGGNTWRRWPGLRPIG